MQTDARCRRQAGLHRAHAASYITSAATFAQWYRDTPGMNHTTTVKLTLWNNGNGAYVNRWGPNGEQWPLTTTAYFCGNVADAESSMPTGAPIPCTFKFGTNDRLRYGPGAGLQDAPVHHRRERRLLGDLPDRHCSTGLRSSSRSTPTRSRRLTERSTATIGPPYGDAIIAAGDTAAPLHNFSFTSEVRYWFQYDATKTYTLDFTGDDDVWLFINKKLAVDLGGIHSPVQGSVTFAAGAAAGACSAC